MSKFAYGRSLIRSGYTWYCQTAGSRWATDPVIGWELFLTAEGTGPATWFLIGVSDKTRGREINTGAYGLKTAMTEAARLMEPPAETPRVLCIQPAAYTDQIVDGQELTKLPYPYFVEADGTVQRQDVWQGTVARVIGFQRDLAVPEISLLWSAAVKSDLECLVGLYLVTSDSDGEWGTHHTAVESVTVVGAERSGEE